MAPTGLSVKKGDVIGYIGESGCSSGGSPGDHSYHLDFSVLRLTNLTGARSYAFQQLLTTYNGRLQVVSGGAGVNGIQGAIDPFGWAAPKGIDPLAWKFIGLSPVYDQPATIKDNGAFSIDLWDPLPDILLPKNGGSAW